MRRRPVSLRDAIRSQCLNVLKAQRKGDRPYRRVALSAGLQTRFSKGVDLGDRRSFYCVLDESGRVILEDKLATTPEAMKQTFARISRSHIALETGTHSPWISQLLTQLRHEVIVAHAQKVDLITRSTREDDRHDVKTLARKKLFDADRPSYGSHQVDGKPKNRDLNRTWRPGGRFLASRNTAEARELQSL